MATEKGVPTLDAVTLSDGAESAPVRSRWILLGGFLLVWIVVFLFPGRTFFGSDDSTIASILQGTYGLSPEPRAVFINFALGTVVSGLASVWPEIGWYGVTMWSVLGLGFGALLVFLHQLAQGLPFAMASLLSAIALFPLLLRITFTTTSIFLGGVALIGLVAQCHLQSVARWKYEALASLMILLSIMLRFNGALAALIVGLPAIILALWWGRLRILAVLGVWVILGCAALGVDAIAYSSPEWSEFRTWTAARSTLMDSQLANLGEVRNHAGWSQNDWNVFRRHRYFDQRIFGVEAVTAGADVAVPRRPDYDYANILRESRLWIVASVTLSLLALGRAVIQRSWFPLWVLLALGWTLLATFGAQWFRFRYRVYDGMVIVGLLIIVASLLISLNRRRLGPHSALVVAFVGLVLATAGAGHAVDRAARLSWASFQENAQEAIEPIAKLSEDFTLLGEASALPRHWDPLRSTDTWGQVRFLSPGWYAFSPPWFARRTALETEGAPLTLLREDVLFVSAPANGEPPSYMSTYLLEHHSIAVTPCSVDVANVKLSVWKFVDARLDC